MPIILSAQSNKFNTSRVNVDDDKKNTFNSTRSNNFNEQRTKLNVEYVKMTRGAWNSFNSSRGIIPPNENEKPVAPVRISNEDLNRPYDNEILFESVVTPNINRNGARPIAPIKEIQERAPTYVSFSFFGTPVVVRKPQVMWPKLKSADQNEIADMLETLSAQEFNNMLYDCLEMKKSMHLDDWPYLQAVKALSESIYGVETNEYAVLLAYILSQSGYKIRLGRSGEKIGVMFASKHKIYHKPYFTIDDDLFYFIDKQYSEAEICPAYFSSEKPLSLWIISSPSLSRHMSEPRYIRSERYPDFNLSVTVDKNLINLFDTYPTSEIGGDYMSRWAMYASTPMSGVTRNELYPKVSKLISGLSKKEAVERILNWIQTGLIYEYDDKVWGGDRAFFPEETLYYPFCDCEDRSILFARIVKDLLRLDCLLVYYPGHLASAVCFDSNVSGDYILYGGKRYVVCDPTYIGAKIGCAMPDMDNSNAKVLVLPR